MDQGVVIISLNASWYKFHNQQVFDNQVGTESIIESYSGVFNGHRNLTHHTQAQIREHFRQDNLIN